MAGTYENASGRNRAWRRDQRRRMCRKAAFVLRHSWCFDKQTAYRKASQYANNLRHCSCGVCKRGIPRRIPPRIEDWS